jgi:DNA primase
MVKTVDNAALDANFACVKGVIGCDRVAELETELRRSGGLLKGRCSLPDHEDRTPSFCCYPDGNGFYGSWWCFGCDRGGDVVDLWQAQQGPFGNLVMAMEDLAEHFGLKLWRPEDLMSETQLAAQKARRRVRAAFDRALQAHYFDLWVMPAVNAVEDLGEREAFLERCLKEAGLAR